MHKLKVALLGLCLPFSIICQTSPENLVVDAENMWIERTYNNFQGIVFSTRYRFNAQTEQVNNLEYSRLQASIEDTGDNWTDRELYRQEEQQVFILENDQEHLILDFGLEVQDTFKATRPNFENDILIVTEVDSIVLDDNSKRKRLYLVCKDDMDGSEYGINVWVEGIGSFTGFGSFSFCAIDREKLLACYSKSDEYLYHMYEDADCWFIQYNTCNYLKGDAEWTYSAWELDCEDPELQKIEVIGDSIVGYRLCSVVGIVENGEVEEGSELVLHYGLTRVQFYEDGVFRTLYNFDPGLQVGDVITYSVPKNFDHYNIYAIQYNTNDIFFKNRIEEINMIDNGAGELVREYIMSPLVDPEVEEEDCHWMPRIIEGVGSTSGFLGQSCTLIAEGCFDGLACHTSGDFSFVVSGGVCDPLAVVDIPDSELRVYPNPFQDEVYFDTKLSFEEISILSMSGELLLQKEYKNSISLENIPTGMFLLVLKDQNGDQVVRKLVKQ